MNSLQSRTDFEHINRALIEVSRCGVMADRVFGPDCPTQRVYEEGAKDVALSSLTGLNCKLCVQSCQRLQI